MQAELRARPLLVLGRLRDGLTWLVLQMIRLLFELVSLHCGDLCRKESRCCGPILWARLLSKRSDSDLLSKLCLHIMVRLFLRLVTYLGIQYLLRRRGRTKNSPRISGRNNRLFLIATWSAFRFSGGIATGDLLRFNKILRRH